MSMKKSSLGKGLEALLQDSQLYNSSSAHAETKVVNSGAVSLPLSKIQTNPYQPRKEIKQESLAELSRSIKIHGLIQPITVRDLNNGLYQLISGERRLKAAQMAGLEEVPVYLRKADDQALLEMALVENVQREDLNPIEIAISLKRIIDECKLKQEDLSIRIAKSRSTVTNYLRLLKLAPEIQIALASTDISMGHAKALLSVSDSSLQIKLFRKVVKQALSVRRLEELIRAATSLRAKPLSTDDKDEQFLVCRGMEEMINHKIGLKSKVSINMQSYKGEIKFMIRSKDELEFFSSLLENLS